MDELAEIARLYQQMVDTQARIEAELPQWLNPHLPDDVHAVVSVADGRVKVTCVGGRSKDELYALEESLEPYLRAGVTAIAAQTGLEAQMTNPRVLRDHEGGR